MTDAVAQTLLNAIPITIAALASGYVTIKRANKKTEEKANETNRAIATNTKVTVESNQKLDAVHQTVNGKNDALVAKLEDALKEIARLRERLARHGEP